MFLFADDMILYLKNLKDVELELWVTGEGPRDSQSSMGNCHFPWLPLRT